MKIKGTFLHSGNSGDTISALPAIREYYNLTGIKPTLYLQKGVEAFYYEGAIHPIKNDSGKNVMLNDKMIEMLIPLIKAQPYIEDVKEWVEDEIPYEDIMCDLAQIRETNVGMPNGLINMWYSFVYPDLAADLTKPWLFVPETDKDFAKGKIIITRTERYQNGADYSFLKPFEDECVFVGVQREWNQFSMGFNLNIRKLNVNNFLELAQAIQQSRFHITNQTMANQINVGLFHPSILEYCTFAPNCIPIGKDKYAFLNTYGLQYYFHKLNGTLDGYMEKLKAAQKETAFKNEKVL